MNNRNEPSPDDHGPFARPLFDDPSVRALSRVGVVDVGSNSVRMVVFDGAARSPAYFYNEKVLCGLGLGLTETGRLNPRGRKRALAALRRFALLAEGMNMAPLTVVATAAVREADDDAVEVALRVSEPLVLPLAVPVRVAVDVALAVRVRVRDVVAAADALAVPLPLGPFGG
jgi:exopolyphosphatase/guanosine-5'-triphosphate,3'-diphosphate pyrophosphatase